ncbi:hypothetical protein C8R48DRAFT_711341 [Suillus tomentosus]|nr:hypothetical protein C8R48DRAFT_711341 [Suillus tomentosus]
MHYASIIAFLPPLGQVLLEMPGSISSCQITNLTLIERSTVKKNASPVKKTWSDADCSHHVAIENLRYFQTGAWPRIFFDLHNVPCHGPGCDQP